MAKTAANLQSIIGAPVVKPHNTKKHKLSFYHSKLGKNSQQIGVIFIIWLKICLNDKHDIDINEMQEKKKKFMKYLRVRK